MDVYPTSNELTRWQSYFGINLYNWIRASVLASQTSLIMSKGIWTKHFSVDGKVYFYNAAQNRSLWVPPTDSIIHEAVNARPPSYIELAGASSSYGLFAEPVIELAPFATGSRDLQVTKIAYKRLCSIS